MIQIMQCNLSINNQSVRSLTNILRYLIKHLSCYRGIHKFTRNQSRSKYSSNNSLIRCIYLSYLWMLLQQNNSLIRVMGERWVSAAFLKAIPFSSRDTLHGQSCPERMPIRPVEDRRLLRNKSTEPLDACQIGSCVFSS